MYYEKMHSIRKYRSSDENIIIFSILFFVIYNYRRSDVVDMQKNKRKHPACAARPRTFRYRCKCREPPGNPYMPYPANRPPLIAINFFFL